MTTPDLVDGAVDAPTRSDPWARRLSAVVGGPAGDHGRPHRWWTPVRVLLALVTVVFCLSLVQHTPCTKTHWSNDEARYGKMCYSDIPYLYTGRGFVEGLWPYADNHGRYQVMEYPVGISYLAWIAAKVTQVDPAGPPVDQRHRTAPSAIYALPGIVAEVDDYFWVTAVVLIGFGLLATWFVAGTHAGRPWDALPFVLSPALLATGLVNWDLMAVACAAGAVWAWSRGRPLLSGVLIGLGAATKLYPLFLLGPVLVLAWRERRPAAGALAAGGAAAAWVLANLPAWLTGMAQWKVFWTFNEQRSADWGSLWLLLARHGHAASSATINHWSWIVFALVCVGVLVLGLVAPEPPRLAQLGYLVVVGFLVVNKVYSPQYVLWLLPLAVLARPRWTTLAIWQAGELFYFAAIWWQLGGYLKPSVGDVSPVYDWAVVVRIAAELFLAAVVVRDVLRPSYDVVRQPLRTTPVLSSPAPGRRPSR